MTEDWCGPPPRSPAELRDLLRFSVSGEITGTTTLHDGGPHALFHATEEGVFFLVFGEAELLDWGTLAQLDSSDYKLQLLLESRLMTRRWRSATEVLGELSG